MLRTSASREYFWLFVVISFVEFVAYLVFGAETMYLPENDTFLQPGKDPSRPGVSRAWFAAIYQVLLGQEEGPRFGGFVALYGIPETVALIEGTLEKGADAA